MKKTRLINKFKLISTSDKKRIRGGNINDTGGIPPYQPGGQGDDDKDDLISVPPII